MLIGISGKARSGKDTVAEMLMPVLQDMGVGEWKHGSFALPVKKIVSEVYGVSMEFIEEWKTKKETPPGWEPGTTMREALVFVGDGFKKFQKKIWVKRFMRDNGMNKLPGSSKNVIVTDARYMHEIQWIKSVGGLIVRVVRDVEPALTFSNASENDLDSWTDEVLKRGLRGDLTGNAELANLLDPPAFSYLLANDGDIDQLRERVKNELVPFLEQKIKFMI